MSYEAQVLADSISPANHRVTSLQVTMPRFILAEFNTHRVHSRNSASSRAIPVERRIEQIRSAPFVPEAFGKNKSGMQASEGLDADKDAIARELWRDAAADAVKHAAALARIEVHKQHANRVIETYAWHTVVVTSTEWDNWDALRVSKLAQPEMFKVAGMMKEVRAASSPRRVDYVDWHLPYVESDDVGAYLQANAANGRTRSELMLDMAKLSAGRCAAVSYERQSSTSDMTKAIARADGLVSNGHMSPLENALRPMNIHELEIFGKAEYVWNKVAFVPTGRLRYFLGNVEGWVQLRKMIPGEDVYRGE